ncbi:hypothetical protein [Nostoc sp. ChiSLP03a]|uniref:hypothetical protein n=1 Tax=Nostoc sp. ChiSLP03a TaxID=3075380 RepID=UPI002AD4BE51|nr:hypothetical protein [Nostoc sp. ChiSLP03a]MDZ8213756.1 hypothetical protein [Nostoc sp. ChiSLP03a]
MKINKIQLGEVTLELLSSMRPVLTFSDFCVPAGTIDFNSYEGFLRNSVQLFSFSYHDFVFEAKIHNGMVFIKRNDLYQHSEQYLGNEPCQVSLQWNADSIGCGIVPHGSLTDMNRHMKSVRTPITIPPSEIVTILRRENLLSNNSYPNMDDFFSTVLDCLHCCQEDIRRHGSETLFWRPVDKIQKPLNEPEITKGVAAFLSIYGTMKNFDVLCETVAGNGRVDFYLVAPVFNIKGLGKIAIEAKKANSNDLEHGLSVQLPKYMQSIGTNYGIYLVYWLKSANDSSYSQNSYPELEIAKLHPIKRPNTIRTVGMDLSIGISPSQKL